MLTFKSRVHCHPSTTPLCSLLPSLCSAHYSLLAAQLPPVLVLITVYSLLAALWSLVFGLWSQLVALLPAPWFLRLLFTVLFKSLGWEAPVSTRLEDL